MWKLLILAFLICSSEANSTRRSHKNNTNSKNGTSETTEAETPSSTDLETKDICNGAFNRLRHAALCLNAQILRKLASTYSQTTVVYSPLATICVLGIMAYHLSGQPKNEVLKTLGLKNDDEISCVFDVIIQLLIDQPEGMELYSAIDMYANSPITFTRDFKKDVAKIGFGEALTLNLTDSMDAVNQMTELLTSQTEGHVTNALSPDDLNSTTQLVYLSGLYFKFNWAVRFDEKENVQDVFRVTPCKSIPITYLHQEQAYRYADSQEIGAKVAEIPFLNQNFKILVIVPNSKNTVRSVLKKLRDYKVFNTVYDSLELTTVDLLLPYFNYSSVVDTREALIQNRFVTSLFDPASAKLKNVVTDSQNVAFTLGYQSIVADFTTDGGDPPTDAPPSNKATLKANKPFITYITIGGIPAFGTVISNPQ